MSRSASPPTGGGPCRVVPDRTVRRRHGYVTRVADSFYVRNPHNRSAAGRLGVTHSPPSPWSLDRPFDGGLASLGQHPAAKVLGATRVKSEADIVPRVPRVDPGVASSA